MPAAPNAVREKSAAEKSQAARNADAHWFRLQARVLSPDGGQLLQVDEKCKTRELRRLTKRLIKDLAQQGAADLLRG